MSERDCEHSQLARSCEICDLLQQLTEVKAERDAARKLARQWSDLYSATLTELRYFSAPGSTTETDGPLLAVQMRTRVEDMKAERDALQEYADSLLDALIDSAIPYPTKEEHD